jgi:predicted secreted hydrolase
MKKIQYTNSPGIPRQSMEEEFLCHKKGFEWWYLTGYMNDESTKLFTYQFTLAKIRVYGYTFNILMTVVTDFETGKHYYGQKAIFFGKDVIITPKRVGVDGSAEMTFEDKKLEGRKMGLNMTGKDYSLTLDIDAVKPPVWHCDNGVLKMGIDAPNQFTYYYSYTNLVVSGKLILEGKEHKVTGKGWFDRQGGPYNALDRRTSWEWFSLRFFDNEEFMLFSFPHVNYQDGTFIDKSGNAKRFIDYKITPLGWTEVKRLKFSLGWKVEMKGVKDQEYTIIPKIDGQFNFFYFEMLADIKDKSGNVVGYCFVELMPGVWNEKSTASAAFARV